MQNSFFDRSQLIRCSQGTLFGESTPRLPSPPLLAFDEVVEISTQGGKFGRGYAIARKDLSSMTWVFDSHVKPKGLKNRPEMLTEADIERAARVVVDKNGSNAAHAAERRINRLSNQGQAEAATIWRRIERAISVMLANEATAAAD